MQHDAIMFGVARTCLNLNLNKGIDPDIEYVTALGEPGIGPPAIVAHTDGGHTVYDAGLCHLCRLVYAHLIILYSCRILDAVKVCVQHSGIMDTQGR